ncbi:hypothetical protein pdam_00021147 [Pocillopora damicornis]|uniref:ShKT domain-containing protein n=1 Tax=Pocillopora damicornis TaxID=46731 RepID=A0A3M6T3Z4_POCDA|nr:hypothetical protein pdam_00021147 [Pocillopora damicornis]
MLMKSDRIKGSCEDKNVHCKSWAFNGECGKNPKYMLFNCPKSCGVCPVCEDKNEHCKSWVFHACEDKNEHCKSWAFNGECGKKSKVHAVQLPQKLWSLSRIRTNIVNPGHRAVNAKKIQGTCCSIALKVAKSVQNRSETHLTCLPPDQMEKI